MNTPISFKLAKLLKEKGFNTPTFYYYENEKLVEPYSENGSSTDTEFRVDLSDLKEYFNKWSKRVSTPTIAEVVMWLYEKHGIWIYVKQGYKWEWYIETVSNHPELKYNDGLEDSPTEAYEAAIEYILNELI
jgi:hypothetical protein